MSSRLQLCDCRVDRHSPIPYYVQVMATLRERIESGAWQPGEQLPGELELCERFNVSRTVIRQALREMTHAGLLVSEKGRGTFVATPKIRESLVQRLTGFYQDMVDQGHTPVTQVLKQTITPATQKVAGRLAIEPGASVLEVERLRSVQGVPMVLVTTFLPYALCPKLKQADLSQQSLYTFLETECDLVIVRGHRSLEAVAANEYEAELLQIAKGAPLIMLDSVSYLADGTAIEYYHALHRGDRSRFEVELVRIRERGKVKEVLGGEPPELPPGSELT